MLERLSMVVVERAARRTEVYTKEGKMNRSHYEQNMSRAESGGEPTAFGGFFHPVVVDVRP